MAIGARVGKEDGMFTSFLFFRIKPNWDQILAKQTDYSGPFFSFFRNVTQLVEVCTNLHGSNHFNFQNFSLKIGSHQFDSIKPRTAALSSQLLVLQKIYSLQ